MFLEGQLLQVIETEKFWQQSPWIHRTSVGLQAINSEVAKAGRRSFIHKDYHLFLAVSLSNGNKSVK